MDNEMKEMFGLILSRLDNLEEQIQDVRTELKTEIQGVRTELKDEIQGVRTELKDEIQGVRTELKNEIMDVRTELKNEIMDVRTELKTEIQGVRTELKDEIQDVRTELKTEIQDVRTDVIDIKTEIAKTTTKYIEAIYGGYKMNVDKFDSVDFNAIKHNTDVALSVSLSNSKITEELAARVAELEKKVG